MQRRGAVWRAGIALVSLLAPMLACAVEVAVQAPAAPPTVVDLEAMVVRGQQPGPGLWKVSKGDHVLWILGTLSPSRRTWSGKQPRSKPSSANRSRC